MDNHERMLLQSAMELLHQLIGYADAKNDFKPILRFVEDDPNVKSIRERLHVVSGDEGGEHEPKQNEKDPDAGTSGAEKGFVEFTKKESISKGHTVCAL